MNSVAETAQRITHSSLDMRIPTRDAGDELDRLIESFNHMMTRLNLSFEQIRQFSTDVSHELRTPLTVIRGQLEVALFTAQTEEQYRDAMVNALEDVERLSQYRSRAADALPGRIRPTGASKERPGSRRTGCATWWTSTRFPPKREGVRLTAELPAALHAFMPTASRSNGWSPICSRNAIKYTPAGGSVNVASGSATRTASKLIVEDTGVGISPEHLPHIFDRFYRVPSADPEKGWAWA